MTRRPFGFEPRAVLADARRYGNIKAAWRAAPAIGRKCETKN
jgi:hypothetical protein